MFFSFKCVSIQQFCLVKNRNKLSIKTKLEWNRPINATNKSKMSPFKYIKRRYQEMKADYTYRSPKGKWMFVRDIEQIFLKFIGVPFMGPTFQVRWYSYVPAVVLIDILLSFFYTVWFYFGVDTIRGFLATSLFGTLTSVRILKFLFHFFVTVLV